MIVRVVVTIVVFCVAMAMPSGARADHWWMNDPTAELAPEWTMPPHMHGGQFAAFPFLNDVNENATARTQTEYSRVDWSASANLDLYNVSTFQGGIHAMDGHYGRIEWTGRAYALCPCTPSAGHASYFDTHLNLTYLTDPNSELGGTWQAKRSVACQEIGHALGIGHAAPSCMGTGYWDCTDQPRPNPCTDPALTSGRTPNQHDLDHIGFMYGSNHPNHWYPGPW
jgi:hypothetical protein